MRTARLLVAAAVFGLAGCTWTGVPAQSTPTAPTAITPATATAESHSLTTHCGISTTLFAGREWVAATPVPEPMLRPDAGAQDFLTEGTMTVVGDDLIRFTVTDPTAEATGLTVDFVPAPASPTAWCE